MASWWGRGEDTVPDPLGASPALGPRPRKVCGPQGAGIVAGGALFRADPTEHLLDGRLDSHEDRPRDDGEADVQLLDVG